MHLASDTPHPHSDTCTILDHCSIEIFYLRPDRLWQHAPCFLEDVYVYPLFTSCPYGSLNLYRSYHECFHPYHLPALIHPAMRRFFGGKRFNLSVLLRWMSHLFGGRPQSYQKETKPVYVLMCPRGYQSDPLDPVCCVSHNTFTISTTLRSPKRRGHTAGPRP
jgi:hypothetical protein